MRSLSLRMTLGVVVAGVFFAIAISLIAAVGLSGVRSATDTGSAIAADELASATATTHAGLAIERSYTTGLVLSMTTRGTQRAALAVRLTDTQLPATDAALGDLDRLHAGDAPVERAGFEVFLAQWATVRQALDAAALADSASPVVAARLTGAIAPVRSHLSVLVARENADADADRAAAVAHSRRVSAVIVGAAVVAVLVCLGLGLVVSRRIRRAVEPAQDQVEFADSLQLAGNEDEANHLLQRHLERTVTGSTAVVLNRNNSADRLEAATSVPVDSPLSTSLPHAEPRSCLAVRSGRSHDESGARRALFGCPVCGECAGSSTCTPLTVGGQVIGSVLVNRSAAYRPDDRQHIRESVSQAAPVLANLRNLAIAELRAATDSLTGLPNKRAVADTLKRLHAQATRANRPLSLLLIDLDHFKDINDRFGHPLGDQALANVGAALRSTIRDSDFAGRNGGEEFAILLPDTDLDGASLTAEKIRAAIQDITLPGLELTVTASVGIATYPQHAASPERLERLADSALYLAKRSGRNRIEIADSQYDQTYLTATTSTTTSTSTPEPVPDATAPH